MAGTFSRLLLTIDPPWWGVFWCLGADGFAPSQFVVKEVLSDGWVLGQAVFTSSHKGGGGEDAQVPKGSKRAGWDVK